MRVFAPEPSMPSVIRAGDRTHSDGNLHRRQEREPLVVVDIMLNSFYFAFTLDGQEYFLRRKDLDGR